jgi:hypothetical protein
MAHTAADEAWWSQASQETAADRWSREFDERMPEPVQAPCGTLGAWGGYDDRAGE